MATTVWKIVNLERVLEDGFIIVAHWSCIASEGAYTYQVYGSEIFDYNPNQPDFIPYENLTESIVVGWIHNRLGTNNVASVEVNALDKLDKIINPVTTVGLPWETPIDTRSFTLPSPDIG